MEVWSGSLDNKFNHLVGQGKVIDAGLHPARGREDWWYPLYVKELCPGLPDWRALNACAPLFASAKTSPKGQYLTGPWMLKDRARIRALNL